MESVNFESINPFVRTVSLHPYLWHNKSHTKAYDARLFYIYSGNGTLSLNHGKPFATAPSDMFLIPPGNSYNFDFNDDDPFWLFTVSFDFSMDFCGITETIPNAFDDTFDPSKLHGAALPPIFQSPVTIGGMKSMLSKLFAMLQEYRLKNAFFRDKMAVLLKDILIDIARNEDKTSTPVTKPVQQLLNYIHANFETDITYEMLSKEFSYHPYYLNRCFKNEIGMTIGRYILEYRLTTAAQLIITTDLTFEQIAYNTGFKNPSHFSAAFKKKYRRSPGNYRKYFLNK